MTFWYQKGKGDDNNIYGKMEIKWPDSLRIQDENDIRFCLEWGKEDQFYQDRPQRLAFYGNADDGEFTDLRIVNLLENRGNKKGLENFAWWCAQPKESKYVNERLDELSNVKITSSSIDKIDKKATLSFIMPLEKGYFYIPQDAIYKVYPSWGIFPTVSNNEQKYVKG